MCLRGNRVLASKFDMSDDFKTDNIENAISARNFIVCLL